MFGIKGTPNQVMREGTNKHLIEELLPDYIDKNKLLSLYASSGDITGYIKSLSEQIIIDTVANSTETPINSIEKAFEFFNSNLEVENYKLAIKMIAAHYQFDMDKFTRMKVDVIDFLLPKWREVIIWDSVEWTNGVVDAIRSRSFNRWVPIDYKFGAPKDKYYMPKIELELTFYKELITSRNAKYAEEFYGERKPWTPVYTENGEMWYVLGGESGIIYVNFCDKFDLAYYTEISEYWKAMDDLSYRFKPEYGYMKNRFDDYCNVVVNNGWKCEFRPICNLSDSFKSENIIHSIGIDDSIDSNIDEYSDDILYSDLIDDDM
jgi:hypothetical protein